MARKKDMRRISMVVTAMTAHNLERLANMEGRRNIGRVMDKLVREKMIALKEGARRPSSPWRDPVSDPPPEGEFVFVRASGKTRNATWDHAPAVAVWWPDGWEFDGFPGAELTVHGWMEVPR